MRLQHYVYWMALTMSPLLLLGWAGVAIDRQVPWRDRALVISWFAAFLLFYIFYAIFDEWWYTRFIFPGYPA